MSHNSPQSQNTNADLALEPMLTADSFVLESFVAALDNGADPNWRDAQGTPLLHRLAARGQSQAMEHALDVGADVHATDTNGNTALFECFTEHAILTLLKAGASPNHLNNQQLPASKHLLHTHDNPSYLKMVQHSSQLLENCEKIESAASSNTLSQKTWQNMTPVEMFSFPGQRIGGIPKPAALSYFLHKMEESGQYVDKDLFRQNVDGSHGLKKALWESESALVAWRDHCEAAGTPMTPDDWKETGVYQRMDRGQRIACLFTADHWAQKASLDDFVQLADALPNHIYNQPDTDRLQQNISNTLREWAKNGGGKDLDKAGLHAFRESLPDKVRDLFGSYHRLQSQRREANRDQNISR